VSGRFAALCFAVLLCSPAALLCGQEADVVDDSLEDEFMDFGVDESGVTLYGRPETTTQTRVVAREEIERRQAPDLAALLEEALDIGITAKGAYGNKTDINIRGFASERIGFLINGVQANDPRTGEFDVSQIDLSNVERIEVIYGGSDSAYNVTGAMGGTINIITRKKQAEGWGFGGGVSNIGYLTGSYNKRHSGGQVGEARAEDLVDTQKLNAFVAYGGSAFSGKLSLSAARAANHYLYEDEAGFARRKESNEVYDLGANADISYSFANDASLSSLTGFYHGNRNFPVTGSAAGYATALDYKLRETLRLDMPVFVREDMSAETSLDLVVSDNRYGAVTGSSDQYASALARWGWYPLDALTARAAVDWRFIHVNSTDNGRNFGNTGGASLAAEYKPWKPLAVVASIKGVTDTVQFSVVPKAGFSWRLLDNDSVQLTLRNNYFRCFRFPDFDDLFGRSFDGLYQGNPDLEAEDGFGLDALVELVAGNFTVSGAFYRQQNRNAIHWVKHDAAWNPENIGFSLLYGGDIRPQYAFNFGSGPFRKLVIGASYQAQFSWLSDSEAYENATRIPYMPEHIAGGSVELVWQTGSAAASAHWESLRYADVMNRMPLEPYCLLNATVNQNLGKHATVSANVRNALNWLYTSFAEYPMPGLSFTLAARAAVESMGKKTKEAVAQ
jgi:outer membrane cobalamin receptor